MATYGRANTWQRQRMGRRRILVQGATVVSGAAAGESAKWFKYDPQQAKQLIAAAGHSNTEIKFTYPNNAYGDQFNAAADTVRGMLSDAGFKITVVTVDYLKDWINNGNGYWTHGLPPSSYGFALQSGFTDADDYLTGMLTPGGNRNSGHVDDPVLTAAIRKAQIELDEAKRVQLVHDIQIMHGQLMYYVPLAHYTYFSVANPWVQNHFIVDDYNFGTEEYAYLSVNNR